MSLYEGAILEELKGIRADLKRVLAKDEAPDLSRIACCEPMERLKLYVHSRANVGEIGKPVDLMTGNAVCIMGTRVTFCPFCGRTQ